MAAARVRRILPAEGLLLRDLRLRSLRDAPDAFGQKEADAASRADEDWQQQARQASAGDRRAWFVAEDTAGRQVGLVQGRRRPPEDLLIFSIWVEPAQRRTGVGRTLIDSVEEWSRSWGAQHSVLWVFGTNEVALRFYGRLGFHIQEDSADTDSGRSYGALALSRAVTPTPA